MKYSRDMLAAAVAQSTSIAGVLRYLNIRQTGGGHSHIRRRITELGIDTSHFTGQATSRRSPRRLTPDQILTVRSPHLNRSPGGRLTAALLQLGVPHECAECGQGPQWNGRRLVLHVDHINGDFADCRPDNLRFLCPHCHSQARNYAGRGSHRSPSGPRPRASPDVEPATVAAAARRLGCSVSQFYRLQREIKRSSQRPHPDRQALWAGIIRYALAHPDEGPRRIAAALCTPEFGGAKVSHGTVSNVLTSVGLNRAEARRSTGIPMAANVDQTVD